MRGIERHQKHVCLLIDMIKRHFCEPHWQRGYVEVDKPLRSRFMCEGDKAQRVERKQHECFRGDLPKHRKFDRHRKTGTEKQASKKQVSKNCDRGGIRYSGTDFENGK